MVMPMSELWAPHKSLSKKVIFILQRLVKYYKKRYYANIFQVSVDNNTYYFIHMSFPDTCHLIST